MRTARIMLIAAITALCGCSGNADDQAKQKAEVALTDAKLQGAVRAAMCSDDISARAGGIAAITKMAAELDGGGKYGATWDIKEAVSEEIERLKASRCA